MEKMLENIRDKVLLHGYRSAKFRLAVVKDEMPLHVLLRSQPPGSHPGIEASILKLVNWKVCIARIVLDVEPPQGQKTLIKENNFALEDFSIPVDTFFQYL